MPVREFPKNSRESVRVMPKIYEGHDLIDIRVYARNKAGKMVPTPKGISINVDTVPELIEVLLWALGQPCDSEPENPECHLSREEAERLAKVAWRVLHEHGSAVHWDSAERMILSQSPGLSKWDLHYVLAIRGDLFERADQACYWARKQNASCSGVLGSKFGNGRLFQEKYCDRAGGPEG
jgi:hypothetical protein